MREEPGEEFSKRVGSRFPSPDYPITRIVKSFAVALILVAFGISQAFAEKINFAFSSISGSDASLDRKGTGIFQ
jgi:hypothetical protein